MKVYTIITTVGIHQRTLLFTTLVHPHRHAMPESSISVLCCLPACLWCICAFYIIFFLPFFQRLPSKYTSTFSIHIILSLWLHGMQRIYVCTCTCTLSGGIVQLHGACTNIGSEHCTVHTAHLSTIFSRKINKQQQQCWLVLEAVRRFYSCTLPLCIHFFFACF